MRTNRTGSAPNGQRASARVREAAQELTRLRVSVDQYRRKDAEHEMLIGKLYDLLLAENMDGALDLVRAEYLSLHGPAD